MSASTEKPSAVRDWHAPRVRQLWTNPDPASDGMEYLLYTDADIPAAVIDEWRPYGEPLHVFATRARAETPEAFAPKLLLRAYHHGVLSRWQQEGRDPTTDDLLKNVSRWWTGMTVDQEAAALLSLASGVRMRSGGPVRRLPATDDVERPEYQLHRIPVLPEVAWTHRTLPGLAGRHFDPRAVLLLGTLQQMSPETAGTLVKAAGAYADALWIADSDPVQGWLRLVTAAETVADFIGLDDEGVEAQFRRAHEKVATLLDERDGELTAAVAELMKGTMGAGAKFRHFFETYPSKPPERRPAEAERQVRWDWTVDAQERKAGVIGMKDALNTIYKHRSKFLHAGTPFPAALLFTPEQVSAASGGAPVYAERPPHHLLQASGTAAWRSAECPMYLHVFAAIVRDALIAWWIEQQSTIDPSRSLADG